MSNKNRYQVFRNLKNGLLSIRSVETGLIVGYAERVVMSDCKYVVNEPGRQRVLREKQKNVHAFVSGTISEIDNFVPREDRSVVLKPSQIPPAHKRVAQSVEYNPYKYDSFFMVSDCPCVNKKPIQESVGALIFASGAITAYIA